MIKSIRLGPCDYRVLQNAKRKLGEQRGYRRLKMTDEFVVGELANMFMHEDARVVIVKEVKRRGSNKKK